MLLLKNNLLSLVCYVAILLVLFFLGMLSILNQTNLWGLVIFIPLLIATPILFILTGRYALKPQGSRIKDLISVLLVCIIGLLLTPGMAYFKRHGSGDWSLNSAYFLYVSFLDTVVGLIANNNGSSWDPLMVGKGVPGLLSGGIFSVIPTLLMWLGLRWKTRKQPSQ